MEMTVIGISDRRSGTSKASGKPFDGTTLHCLKSKSKDVISGQAVSEIYLNHLSGTFPSIKVGDLIDVEYDNKGYIEAIEVIKSTAPAVANPFNPAPPAVKTPKSAE